MNLGQKFDSLKMRYSLLPKSALNQVIEVLEYGARKYAPDNWQHVDNARERYYDALMRHVDAWWQGEVRDSESGLHHLAHATCCALFLIWFDKEGASHGASIPVSREDQSIGSGRGDSLGQSGEKENA